MKIHAKPIFTAIFVFAAAAAFAQVSIGPRAGINLATWDVSDDVAEQIGSVGNRLSLLFGAVAEIRINDHFAVQPELDFIQKGFSSESNYTDPVLGNVSGSEDVVTNNLEIPVLVKAGGAIGPVRIDGLAGPSFAYSLNGKLKTKISIGGQSDSSSEDINFEDDQFSRTDLGIQLGLAVGLNLGESAKLFLDGRYLLGFTNLNTSGEDGEVKNRGIAISAGVLFPL